MVIASERRRVLVGTSYAFLSTIVALGTAIITRPLMVRFLGIGPYGVLVLGLSLLGIITIAADLGVGGALTKFVAEERGTERRRALISTGIVASFASGLVLTAVVLALAEPVASFFGMPQLAPALFVLAWQSPFAFAAVACLAAVNGLRWMRVYGAGSIISSLTAFGFVIAALLAGGGIVEVAWAMVASSMTSFAVLATVLRGFLRVGGLVGFRATIRGLVLFGIQMSAANAVSTVLYQVDTTMLGAFTRSDYQVGHYSIAILVARLLWILPGSISVVAFPALSEYTRDQHRQRTQQFIDRALRFSSAIVGLAAIGLVYLGEAALGLLFGPDGLPAFEPLLILLLGAGVLGVSKSVAVGLSSAGRPDLGFKIALAGLLASVVLGLAFIPSYGLTGAAWATTVAYSLLAVLVLASLRRVLSLRLPVAWLVESSLWVGGACSGALALHLLGLGGGWIQWSAGVFAMFGFVAVLYLRLIPREDTLFLWTTVKQSLRHARSSQE